MLVVHIFLGKINVPEDIGVIVEGDIKESLYVPTYLSEEIILSSFEFRPKNIRHLPKYLRILMYRHLML
jgi:hypothetical protein